MTTRLARFVSLFVLALTTLSLFAAGRPLAPRTIAPSSNYVFNPVTAYAGGRFLTIWHETMGFLGRPVMGAFSDASGARISPRSFPLDIPPVDSPFYYALVGTGDTFTLFRVGSEERTSMYDVDLEGNVTNERPTALPFSLFPQIVWNGTHFAAVIRLPSTQITVVTMFDREGRTVLEPVPIPAETNSAAIVAAGDRFVVVKGEGDAVIAHAVTAAGLGARTKVDSPGGSTALGYRPSRVVATATGNGDLLVVWGATFADRGELRSAILRADGTRTAEVVVTAEAEQTSPLEIIRTGSGYLVAYAARDALRRVRLDAAGARAGETEAVPGTFTSLSPATGADTILFSFLTAPHGLADVGTVAVPADGQPRPAEIVSLNYTTQLQPILAMNGSEVLATWTELAGDVPTVRATSVTLDGEHGAVVEITDGFLATTETPWNEVSSPFDDGHHLVMYRDATRLLATRVTAGEPVVDATPIVLGGDGSSEAAAVWVDSRWVVVWTEDGALRSLTISRDGTASEARTLDVHAPVPEGLLRSVGSPRLAYDGGEVLLVWRETLVDAGDPPMSPLTTKTWAIRLSRTGALFDAQPLDLDLDGPSLSVASGGFDFAVLAGQHLRILKGDGPLRITAARDLFGWPAVSDVTWERQDYAVALRYYGAETDWYLGVLSFRGDGSMASLRVTATLPPDVERAPSIAGRGQLLFGVQEGTVEDGFSASVYTLEDFAFAPDPPSPPRNVHVRQLSSFEYEVNWNAPAEGEPSSYIVEQFFSGTWTVAARVEGDVHRANVTAVHSVPVVRVRAFNAGGPSEPAEQGSDRPRRRSVR